MRKFSSKEVITINLTLQYSDKHPTYEALKDVIDRFAHRHSLMLEERGTALEAADFTLTSQSLSLSVVPFLEDLRRAVLGVSTIIITESKETMFNLL